MLPMALFVNQIRGYRVGDDRTHQIDNPDWDTIEKAIRDLGKRSLAMELCHIVPDQAEEERVFMGIAGGAKNAYSVFVHDGNGFIHLLRLRCEEISEPDIEDPPPATLDDAIQAARTFAVQGQLDRSYQWNSHSST